MQTSDLFRALSEPIRLRVIYLLMHRGPELCVCDLVTVLDLPQGTISRHLMQLRYANLVEDRREGVWMYYSLADGASKLHAGILKLLGDKSDDPELTADLERFDKLKCCSKLACCGPRPLQGRVTPSQLSPRKAGIKS
jgi:ArsR family transcriptional regulator, arsenate/arsenite/antimonite-responsive transcriptional repressor